MGHTGCRFFLKNTGYVAFSFKWFLLTLEASQQQQKDEHATVISEAGEIREESTVISLHPVEGEILPGREQTIMVKFSPVEVGEFKELLRCK